MTTRDHRLSKDRRTLTTNPVKAVAICGGTHGNETNGVYLAKYFMTNKTVVSRPSFETTVLLTNTAAVQANQRYVETDMNRCFTMVDLANPALDALEQKRAKEIDQCLGPKASVNPKCDFVIDMHNTTANTGVALLMDATDHFAHQVAAHLVSVDPTVRIVNWAPGKDDYGLLPTIGRSGMTFEKSVELIVATLDYIHAHNEVVKGPKRQREELSQMQVEVYQRECDCDYPRDKEADDAATALGANLTAFVHPQLQDNDFVELTEGFPIFQRLDNTAVLFHRADYQLDGVAADTPVYPFFCNEAAYYEKGTAFMLATKHTLTIDYISHE